MPGGLGAFLLLTGSDSGVPSVVVSRAAPRLGGGRLLPMVAPLPSSPRGERLNGGRVVAAPRPAGGASRGLGPGGLGAGMLFLYARPSPRIVQVVAPGIAPPHGGDIVLPETTTALERADATGAFGASLTETAASSASVGASLGVFSARSEAVTASSSLSGLIVFNGFATEIAAASSSVSGRAAFATSQPVAAIASAATSGALAASIAIAASSAATDTRAEQGLLRFSILEVGTAGVLSSGLLTSSRQDLLTALVESTSADSVVSASLSARATIASSATATNDLMALRFRGVQSSEIGGASFVGVEYSADLSGYSYGAAICESAEYGAKI